MMKYFSSEETYYILIEYNIELFLVNFVMYMLLLFQSLCYLFPHISICMSIYFSIAYEIHDLLVTVYNLNTYCAFYKIVKKIYA